MVRIRYLVLSAIVIMTIVFTIYGNMCPEDPPCNGLELGTPKLYVDGLVALLDADVLASTEYIEATEEAVLSPEFVYFTDISEDDAHLIACTVYLEGRGESYECQKHIASVILNRYASGGYDTIADVIYEPGQFSTSKYINSTRPTQTQLDAVYDVINNGCSVPYYVVYFRANYYHSFEDAFNYVKLDDTYFSGSYRRKEARDVYDTD